MSTRSNIIIKYGKNNILLYRHCDGYLDGAGQDLHDCLNSSRFSNSIDEIGNFNIAKFVNKLLIDDCSYRLDDQLAGDIEYLYIFEFTDNYEHGDHYNRVKLKSITVNQNYGYGKGGKEKYKSLSDFQNAILKFKEVA